MRRIPLKIRLLARARRVLQCTVLVCRRPGSGGRKTTKIRSHVRHEFLQYSNGNSETYHGRIWTIQRHNMLSNMLGRRLVCSIIENRHQVVEIQATQYFGKSMFDDTLLQRLVLLCALSRGKSESILL